MNWLLNEGLTEYICGFATVEEKHIEMQFACISAASTAISSTFDLGNQGYRNTYLQHGKLRINKS
jgi:hypothetical protein